MCFVNENTRAMGGHHITQLYKMSKIAVHRINTFDDHQLAPSLLTAQRNVERGRIVMLEFLRATPRQNRTVTKTQMRAVVQNRDVALPQQAGNRTQRAAKSAVEKHGVLAVEKLRDAPFEFAVEIGHA